MASMKDVYGAITKGDKKPPKKIRRHSMHMSHDGKIIHTHEHHYPEHHGDETHVSNNAEEMQKHLADNVVPNMSATPPAMPEQEGGEQAAPAAPAM